MWQIAALTITAIGIVLFYLSHKNQKLINAKLGKGWRIISYILLIFSLVLWMVNANFYPAFFMWLFSGITILGLIPFFGLLKKKEGTK